MKSAEEEKEKQVLRSLHVRTARLQLLTRAAEFIDCRKVVQARSSISGIRGGGELLNCYSTIRQQRAVTPDIHAYHLGSSIVARRGISIWLPNPGGPMIRWQSDFSNCKPTINVQTPPSNLRIDLDRAAKRR